MRSYMRAENPDFDSLGATFVTLPQLKTMMDSPEHQILYGRRGTGKTHMLRLLAKDRLAAGSAASEVVAELYDQRLLHRRRQGVAGLEGRPLTEKYDMFLVDLGSFMDLIINGQLRLIDHGVRDRGIARMSRTARTEARKRTAYTFVTW